jgi:hypothetical protein
MLPDLPMMMMMTLLKNQKTKELFHSKSLKLISRFLMNLPGVTATDSMGYRIEALRVYLENQLGDVAFIAAYKHLLVSSP